MATERYIIEIQERGTRAVQRNIADIGRTSSQATNSLGLMRRALALIGGALAVRKIIEFADAVTNLRNRINLFSQSTAQTTVITKELFDIAAATRSDFETTGQVYTRLALSAKNLGRSQAELLQVTKSINQAVILSGTNAREAANGLIQLSQAIASNRLGGDELRSVLEQLPLVTDIIGAELVRLGLAVRGTRAEVRQLGFDGKITAEIIINAFLRAGETLEKQFAGTIPTVGQALTVLTTRFIQFVSEVNDASGATRALAEGILLVARNLDTLSRVVGALAIVAVLGSAAKVTSVLAAALGGLPVAALLTLVGLLITFSDKITLSRDGVVTLADALRGGFTVALEIIRGLIQATSEFLGLFGTGRSLVSSFVDIFVGGLELIASAIDGALLKLSGGLIGGGLTEALNAAKEIARVTAEQRRVREEISRQEEEIERKRLSQAGPAAPALPSPDQLKAAQKRADLLAKVNAQLDAEARILTLTNGEREIANDLLQIENQFKEKLTETERAVIRGKLVSLQQLRDEAEILDELRGPQEDLVRTQEALNRLHERGAITLEEYNRKLLEARLNALETSQTLEGGVARGFLRIQQEITDVASVAENALVDAFHTANDALLEFIGTGKFNLEQFGQDILGIFNKLALAQVQAAILGGGAGGGAGGIISLFGSLFSGPGAGADPATANVPFNARHGADFTVGGAGGTDRNLVAFRASRGERVTVTPRDEVGRGGSQRPVQIVMNIQTPDAESFRRSEGQIMSRAQASLQRARSRNG